MGGMPSVTGPGLLVRRSIWCWSCRCVRRCSSATTTSALKELNAGQKFREYGFEAFYCLPGRDGAHEKGGVEGDGGRFRRAHLVPVPAVDTLAELNARLAAADRSEDGRRIDGRAQTVGEAFAVEAPLLVALPAERFDTPGSSRSATTSPPESLKPSARAGSVRSRDFCASSCFSESHPPGPDPRG
jgi:hypothetical protein